MRSGSKERQRAAFAHCSKIARHKEVRAHSRCDVETAAALTGGDSGGGGGGGGDSGTRDGH